MAVEQHSERALEIPPPPPSRRGFVFYGSAALAACFLSKEVASASPGVVTQELLLNYNLWLWSERRVLCSFLEPHGYQLWTNPPTGNRASAYHATDKIGRLLPDKGPLDRAAIVLNAVGCDWRA